MHQLVSERPDQGVHSFLGFFERLTSLITMDTEASPSAKTIDFLLPQVEKALGKVKGELGELCQMVPQVL